MRYFFFGTLMDAEVRELALGRRVPAEAIRPARLHGYRLVRALEEPSPVLLASPGGIVEGLLVDGLDAEDVARVSYFEDDEYTAELCTVTVDDGGRLEAWAHIGSTLTADTQAAWELGHWQATEKEAFLVLASTWMAFYGAPDLDAAREAWRRAKHQLFGAGAVPKARPV